jgi:hypothetical protein
MPQLEPSEIRSQLQRARDRLVHVGGPFAAQSGSGFDTDAADVAAWIAGAAQRALAGDYVEYGRPSPPADRLYLEMNRFEINPDCWFMDAFACAPPPGPSDPVNIGPEFDAIVGYYMDASVAETFVLTGMEEMQRLYAHHGNDGAVAASARAAEDVVKWSWFDLLHRAWARGGVSTPVSAAIHDEDDILHLPAA